MRGQMQATSNSGNQATSNSGNIDQYTASSGMSQQSEQIVKENHELKARLAAISQLYGESLKENGQLKQLIERNEAASKEESHKVKAALLERDKTIGALQSNLTSL